MYLVLFLISDSIEMEKQKAEHDRMLRLAEEKKQVRKLVFQQKLKRTYPYFRKKFNVVNLTLSTLGSLSAS